MTKDSSLTHTRRGGARGLAAALTVAALLLAPGAAQAAKPLKRGSEGPRVAQVQRWLGISADGVFGSGTRRAVKRFQRRQGLTADGIVGPATWAALRRGHRAATRRTSAAAPRVRSRGGAVRILQRRLGVAADGVFGPATEA